MVVLASCLTSAGLLIHFMLHFVLFQLRKCTLVRRLQCTFLEGTEKPPPAHPHTIIPTIF